MSAVFKFPMYLCRFGLLALTAFSLIIAGQSEASSVNNSKRVAAVKDGNFDNYANLKNLPLYYQSDGQTQNNGSSTVFDFESKFRLINSLVKPDVLANKFSSRLYSEDSREFPDKATNNTDCTVAPINFGQAINGTLSTTDCFTGFRYYDDYTFSGRAGQKIAVSMNSSAFDTDLRLLDSSGQSLVIRFGFSNARIFFTLPADGIYRIRASSNQPKRTGEYTLGLTDNGFCDLTPTSINFGRNTSGTLSTADCYEDKAFGEPFYYDDYIFSGAAGQNIIVTMTSTDFDTNFQLYSQNNQFLIRNSLSSGGGNSRLLFTLPANGNYTIRASSANANQTGSYILTLINDAACNLTPTPINFGQTVNNALSVSDCANGYFYDEYTLSGTAGQNITIEMSSTVFPVFLELYDPGGSYLAASDNPGNDTNSQINLIIPSTGVYKIRATSFAVNKIGEYKLTVFDNTALCVSPPLGMIAWYKGEERAEDSIGYKDNRNLFGSPNFFFGNFSSGKVGQTLYFNGIDNLVIDEYFPEPGNSIRTEVTLAAWVKQTKTGGDQTIISKYNGNTDGVSFRLTISRSKVYFQVNQSNSVSRSIITVYPVILPGSYKHIAAVFNSSTGQMEIFVNGAKVPVILINSDTVTSIQEEHFTQLGLGFLPAAGNQSTQHFAGQIDEAQIFNRALTGAEVKSIHDAGNAGVCGFSRITGKISTPGGRPLSGIPVSTADGLRTVTTNEAGIYSINLEPGYNHTIKPRFSTHGFSPADYSFNPLSGDRSGRDFTAAFLNDNFADAVILPGESGEIDGNNQEATREIGEPIHAGIPGGTSVWYRWRAPRNGQFTFSLGESRFDTLLAVYTGTNLENLAPAASNDNIAGIATFSRLTFTAAAHTDYWIAIDGRAGAASSGNFKMIYYPADHAPGFTVSGSIRNRRFPAQDNPIRAVTIKAETIDGDIIATAVTGTDGTYSIVLPQGVNSFKLTAFGYGFTLFSNIEQNQTYNFIIPPPSCNCGFTVVTASITGSLFFGGNPGNVTVTVSGANTGSSQCLITPQNNPTYTCAGLLPFGTYTITPSHPTFTFTPASRTFVNLSSNGIVGASFIVNEAPGFTISGRVTKDGAPLSGVRVRASTSIFSFFDTETDADGRYSISPLPAGLNFTITASLPGFSLQPAGVTVFTNLQSNQTVNFSGSSNCAYHISPLGQNISAAGGFGFFDISANAGCPWEAKTGSAGIVITSPPSFGSGRISYFVEPNTGAARAGTITVAGQTLTINQAGAPSARRVLYDFDGDRKSDISVFRPDNGVWYVQQSTDGFSAVQFGIATDRIAPADYDGDGKTDVAVYRDGVWYLQRSRDGFFGISFGISTDIPIPADFDGDGSAETAVFRPSDGTWYIYNLANNQFNAVRFGLSGDVPVAADYDGDGRADIAVFRSGNWYLLGSRDGFTAIAFGQPEDKPVAADYDGDGRTDVAVFRPSAGTWYLQQSSEGFKAVQFGISTDKPAPADYDGDGRADIAVFREGVWYLQQSTGGFNATGFGIATDKPVPNSFVP